MMAYRQESDGSSSELVQEVTFPLLNLEISSELHLQKRPRQLPCMQWTSNQSTKKFLCQVSGKQGSRCTLLD